MTQTRSLSDEHTGSTHTLLSSSYLKVELVNNISFLKARLLPGWSSVGAAGSDNSAKHFNANKGLFVRQGSG